MPEHLYYPTPDRMVVIKIDPHTVVMKNGLFFAAGKRRTKQLASKAEAKKWIVKEKKRERRVEKDQEAWSKRWEAINITDEGRRLFDSKIDFLIPEDSCCMHTAGIRNNVRDLVEEAWREGASSVYRAET